MRAVLPQGDAQALAAHVRENRAKVCACWGTCTRSHTVPILSNTSPAFVLPTDAAGSARMVLKTQACFETFVGKVPHFLHTWFTRHTFPATDRAGVDRDDAGDGQAPRCAQKHGHTPLNSVSPFYARPPTLCLPADGVGVSQDGAGDGQAPRRAQKHGHIPLTSVSPFGTWRKAVTHPRRRRGLQGRHCATASLLGRQAGR